ncbi:MAG TPA: sigma-54-dependent Fis family transcriptional regulator, partial [Oxalobacteraceae bacterium]|nr:sigma-54-dependent Fis family transcriptional regulator [Oxalobacteraceae bacterium]
AFREDLYYRLNGLVVKLPPLRERTDLEAVINKLLAAESGALRYTVSPDIMQLFKQHNWPGNFRQLTNLLRTAMVMAGDDLQIRLEHLPDDFLEDISGAQQVSTETSIATASLTSTASPVPQGSRLDEVTLSTIQRSLAAHGGNVSATAKALGVSRNTIYRKLQAGQ